MTDEIKYTVFVYGTLKKGQPNGYMMEKNILPSVEYLGRAITKLKYPLIISGPWNLPMLLNIEGKGMVVQGELYKVDEKDLKLLDKFEGHPDFYERTEVETLLEKKFGQQVPIKCWTYFYKDYTDSDLQLQFFDNYDSTGCHGKVYDTSENEDHPSHT